MVVALHTVVERPAQLLFQQIDWEMHLPTSNPQFNFSIPSIGTRIPDDHDSNTKNKALSPFSGFYTDHLETPFQEQNWWAATHALRRIFRIFFTTILWLIIKGEVAAM